MQIAGRNTVAVTPPSIYRNRPYSPAFNTPRPELSCDVVYLIIANSAVREEIAASFSALPLKVIAFATATEYLRFKGEENAACLILDTHLLEDGGSGLRSLLALKGNPPVIFVSDYADIPSTVRAMKAGAIEFLTSPIDLPALLAAVDLAFAQDRKRRRKHSEFKELQARFTLLTPREREVLPLVVGGLLNKQAASILGISEVTLQIHRSQIMRKTRADSFADLVRMAVKLHIPHWSACNMNDPRRAVQTFAVPHAVTGALASAVAQ